MLNPVQIDNIFCFVQSRPAFISNEEIFAYAFYLGYLIIDNDYSGMRKLSLCSFGLEIDISCDYTSYCTKCGDNWPCLCGIANGTKALTSIDSRYTFINPHSQRTIFSVHHQIRF